ncbi:MAG: ribonuclease III [Verrucomicrobia bacterium]|nr:ribonuclease III [Verrucomicrobiota bacterium]
MDPITEFRWSIPDLQKKLNYTFADQNLLLLAFTHRSFVNEHRHLVQHHNERLEFLGDAVLGMIIAEYLYHLVPDMPEGELSHLRASFVQASSCSRYLEKLDVSDTILLGRGERLSIGRGRDSILADLFEAIIGAVFLDGGLEAAKNFLFSNFGLEFAQAIQRPERNFKAELQDWSQRIYKMTPVYAVLEEQGPDHAKQFRVSVSVNNQELGVGAGNSKKEAQQQAAEEALKGMKDLHG